MSHRLINIDTLSNDTINHEIFIRYGASFNREKMDTKKRILKFKAVQILGGNLEGFPLRAFDEREMDIEKRDIQDRYEQLCLGLSRAEIKERSIAPYFTELIFLFGRAYHLNFLETDDATDSLLKCFHELLDTHYNQPITISETEVDSTDDEEEVKASQHTPATSAKHPSRDSSPSGKAVKPPGNIEVEIQNETLEISIVNVEATLRRPCFRCQEYGHWKENCTNKRVRGKRVRSPEGGLFRKGSHL